MIDRARPGSEGHWTGIHLDFDYLISIGPAHYLCHLGGAKSHDIFILRIPLLAGPQCEWKTTAIRSNWYFTPFRIVLWSRHRAYTHIWDLSTINIRSILRYIWATTGVYAIDDVVGATLFLDPDHTSPRWRRRRLRNFPLHRRGIRTIPAFLRRHPAFIPFLISH